VRDRETGKFAQALQFNRLPGNLFWAHLDTVFDNGVREVELGLSSAHPKPPAGRGRVVAARQLLLFKNSFKMHPVRV
jgi:hypothetical protein